MALPNLVFVAAVMGARWSVMLAVSLLLIAIDGVSVGGEAENSQKRFALKGVVRKG